jgi:hypothetical protein
VGAVMAHIEFDATLNRFVLKGAHVSGLPRPLDPRGIDYGKPEQETVMGNMAIKEDYSRFVSDKKVPR